MDKKNSEIMKWLFLLSGIYGVFRLFQSVDEFEWDFWLLCLIVVVVFVFEFRLRTHLPIYMCVTGFMLVSPMFGISFSLDVLFFLAIFQFSFWVLQNMETGGKSLSFHRLGRITLIGLTAFFCLAAIAVYWDTEWFYQAAYQVEGAIQRNVKSMTGISDQLSDGVISRGNLYPAGIEEMEVRVSKEPTETMYLKNFNGGGYVDGVWEPADEEAVFKQMNENTLHWEDWRRWVSRMYYSMYFVMNENTKRDTELDSREMFIQYKNNSINNWPAPYYSIWNRGGNNLEEQEDFQLEYYELEEMSIEWDNVNNDFVTPSAWYFSLQEAYGIEAQEAYIDVPKEDVSRLVEFCENNPKQGIEEITDFILDTLQDDISYTQTPGMFPLNQDPVEYFLFEHKEGYCQHFASTATLMYRLYGIPARYATGYAVSVTDFEPQADGQWRAEVTDQSAHAWPEIYIEDYGWVPVEVTSSSSRAEESLPRSVVNQSEILQRDNDSNLETDSSRRQEEEDEREDAEKTEETGLRAHFSMPDKKTISRSIFWFVFVILLWTILWNRQIRMKWMRRGGCRRIYRQLICIIHFAGYVREYDGSEKGFSAIMAQSLPEVSEEAAKKLSDIVYEEVFGQDGKVSYDKEVFVEQLYDKVSNAVVSRMPMYKKLWFYFTNCMWR